MKIQRFLHIVKHRNFICEAKSKACHVCSYRNRFSYTTNSRISSAIYFNSLWHGAWVEIYVYDKLTGDRQVVLSVESSSIFKWGLKSKIWQCSGKMHKKQKTINRTNNENWTLNFSLDFHRNKCAHSQCIGHWIFEHHKS